MAVYIITGKLGGGKTLCSVGLMRDALREGRRVATNIDLKLEHLIGWRSKSAQVFRLPDKLSAESFEQIGIGNESYDEYKNGLIVLDEGGLSMNSRDYREEGRKEFIRWAIHSRKKGWDMAIIIQHVEGLDKQIRDFFGEHVVRCIRLDRLRIPLIGWLLQFAGFEGTFPRLHKAVCRYGQGSRDLVTWRKWFRGADLYDAYDTRQAFDPDIENGVYQVLPPYYVKGRYHSAWDETKLFLVGVWKRHAEIKAGRLFVFFCAAILGGWAHALWVKPNDSETVQEVVQGTASVLSSVSAQLQEQEFDPWDFAYISNYLEIPSRNIKRYKFRDIERNTLLLPVDWAIAPIDSCNALIKSPERLYTITCQPPEVVPPDNLLAGGTSEGGV